MAGDGIGMRASARSPLAAEAVQSRLRSLADPRQAANLARFFKTGPGEYGEGDVFLGIKVPVLRRVAGEFNDLPLAEVVRLVRSEIHEERLTALLIVMPGRRGTGPVCRNGLKGAAHKPGLSPSFLPTTVPDGPRPGDSVFAARGTRPAGRSQ